MYEIPTKVNIGGTEYQIRNNGDYRMVLDCFGGGLLIDVDINDAVSNNAAQPQN